MKFLFDDGHQHVNTDGNPDLSLYSIFRGAIERFNSQMLLDPFEEELYLPSASIKLRDGQGWKRKIVG